MITCCFNTSIILTAEDTESLSFVEVNFRTRSRFASLSSQRIAPKTLFVLSPALCELSKAKRLSEHNKKVYSL